MTRGHRKVHRLLWPALAVVIALGFTMALVKRPPPEPSAGKISATGKSTPRRSRTVLRY